MFQTIRVTPRRAAKARMLVSSNRIFVTVECLYGFKVVIASGLKRIVKP